MTTYPPAFNARLISEVKKHPCLYNHAKRGSGDTMERMRIWEHIASNAELNCSGDFAKKRWLQLRDRYRKELKAAIRQNFSTPVRWCYFSHLSWLDPYLKDNLALAAGDSINESMDFGGIDISQLADVKCEMMEGLNDNDNSGVFESSLDRVLAATHRHESISPGLENDDSGPQSVGTSGDDEKTDSGTVGERAQEEERFQKSRDNFAENNHMPLIQTMQPTFSIKEQVMARQVQQNQLVKQIYQEAAKSAVDWVNDEDMLYSRIIGLRMKNMSSKKRKRVRAQIMSLLDDSDSEPDECFTGKSSKIEEPRLRTTNVTENIVVT